VYAFKGIAQLFRQEPNARLHAFITIVVIAGGIYKGLHAMQWVAISIAIGLVWIVEALNTGIEMLCDMYCNKEWHPVVKIIKDISAGAVLIAAITSAAIGIFIFFFS
ncbi:MAG: diacylglycerol kinase family protein, partial [Bacteroidetes bacterium]|nr:diacylglycerol kinase family protein [Bacteroidota bacterium]